MPTETLSRMWRDFKSGMYGGSVRNVNATNSVLAATSERPLW